MFVGYSSMALRGDSNLTYSSRTHAVSWMPGYTEHGHVRYVHIILYNNKYINIK